MKSGTFNISFVVTAIFKMEQLIFRQPKKLGTLSCRILTDKHLSGATLGTNKVCFAKLSTGNICPYSTSNPL